MLAAMDSAPGGALCQPRSLTPDHAKYVPNLALSSTKNQLRATVLRCPVYKTADQPTVADRGQPGCMYRPRDGCRVLCKLQERRRHVAGMPGYTVMTGGTITPTGISSPSPGMPQRMQAQHHGL